jgi:hypothetical protein
MGEQLPYLVFCHYQVCLKASKQEIASPARCKSEVA